MSELDWSVVDDPDPEQQKIAQDSLDRAKNQGWYQRNLGYYLRSNLREVVQPFTGNTQSDDPVSQFLPSGFSGLYSLADLGSKLAQRGVGVADEDLFELPGAQAATEHYQASRRISDQAFGVEEAEDTPDLVLGLAPSLLVPTPDKLNKLFKTVEGGSKVANAARVATSLISPLRQNKLNTIAGKVEVALPFALTEGLEAGLPLTGDPELQEGIPGYKSSLGIPAAHATEDKPLDWSIVDQDPAPPQPDPNNIEDMPHGNNPEASAIDRDTLMMGAAATGATVAAIVARRRGWLASRRAPLNKDLFGEMEVKNKLGAASDFKAGYVDKNAPAKAAMQQVGVPQEVVDDVMSDIAISFNPHALNARLDAVSYSGVYPEAQTVIEPMVYFHRAAGELSPDQMKLLNNALYAQDTLSRMKQARARAKGGGSKPFRMKYIMSRDGTRKIHAEELQKLVDDAFKDPRVSQLMTRSQVFWDGMRKIAHEAGLINQATSDAWREKWPHFIHMQINAVEGDDLTKQLARFVSDARDDGVSSAEAIENWLLPARNRDPRKGVLPGEGLAAILGMERYSHNLVRAIVENKTRKDFVEKMLAHQDDKNPILKEISEGQALRPNDSDNLARGPRVISILDKGEKRYFRVYDEGLHDMLMNKPAWTIPVLNTWRQAVQATYTGVLAPSFLPTSLSLETTAAALMRMKGYGTGPLDELVSRLSGGRFNVSDVLGVDPSLAASWATGTARGLYGAFLKEMSARFAAGLAGDTGMARIAKGLGINPNAFAQTLHDAYMRSMHFQFNMRGGATTPSLQEDSARALSALSSMSSMAPTIVTKHMKHLMGKARGPSDAIDIAWARVKSNMLYRSYTALMNAMHNSVKLQAYAANATLRKGETMNSTSYNKRMTRVAAKTRALTGDPTVTGKAAPYRTAVNVGLYVNVAAQTTFQLARAFRDHPFRFVGSLVAMGYGVNWWLNEFFQDDPETAHWYYNVLTPAQRSSLGIPMYVDENGDMKFMPVEQNLRPVVSVMTELYGMMSGVTHPMSRRIEDQGMLGKAFNEVFRTGLSEHDFNTIADAQQSIVTEQLLPDLIGPATGTAIALTGMKPGSLWTGRGGIQENRGSRLSPDDEALPDAALPLFIETAIEEAAGGLSRWIIDGANTFKNVMDGKATPEVGAEHIVQQMAVPTEENLRDVPGAEKIYGNLRRQKQVGILTTAAKLNGKSEQGIKQIMAYAQRGIMSSGVTGSGAGAMTTPGYGLNLRGTPLMDIVGITQEGMKDIAPMREKINQLKSRTEAIRTDPKYLLDNAAAQQEINMLRYNIVDQEALIQEHIQRVEDTITARVGRRFRYREFNMNDWMQ